MDIPALAVSIGPAGGDALRRWWEAMIGDTSDVALVVVDNAKGCEACVDLTGAGRAIDAALAEGAEEASAQLRAAGRRPAYGPARLAGRLVPGAAIPGRVGHVVSRNNVRDWRRRAGLPAVAVLSEHDLADFLESAPIVWLTDHHEVQPPDADPVGLADEICNRLGLDYMAEDDAIVVLEGRLSAGAGARVPTFWDSTGYECWGPVDPAEPTGRTRDLRTGEKAAREVVLRWSRGLTRPVMEGGALRWYDRRAPLRPAPGVAARAQALRSAS
jgi:hypothetical protein